jgi:osmotically-inducible protein OsmY
VLVQVRVRPWCFGRLIRRRRATSSTRAEIREDVLLRTLWVDARRVELDVRRGIVTLSGRLDRRSDVELLELLVRRVPGVISVASSLACQVDDTTRRGRAALERAR